MSNQTVVVILCVVAGLLLGGVYSTWKTAKMLAMVLLVLAVLAGVGAVVWLAS